MLTNKNPGSTLLIALALILLVLSSPAAAAVSGFVAKADDGNLYEYSYADLLDSYSLSILGSPDGYYEDFAEKETYAILNSAGRYLDYKAILDSYARALVNGESFDLTEYAKNEKAKTAEMPSTIKMVKFNSGKIVYSTIETNSGQSESNPGYVPRGTKTPIVGSAEATVEQAREWAKSRGAHRRFVDIAAVYWEYAKETGMRPEVLYAQAAMETNFGKYDAVVPPEFNNWAGIKKADAEGDSRNDHEAFDTPEEGVRAHFNHLSAYLGLKLIGEPHERYHVVAGQSWAGSVLYVEDLSGKWTPSEEYHVYILIAVDQILDKAAENDNNENPDQKQEEHEPESGINNPDKNYVSVDVSILHLRDGPSTDDKILDRLNLGTVLEVTGNQGKWLKVIVPGSKSGWVHGDYVKKIDLESSDSIFEGKIVVVDPGHGGSDPGAIGITGLQEKVVNLAVAKELIPLLEKGGAIVITTRSGDHSVSNSRRVEIVNDSGADVYISIHANAFSNSESNGTETHYCSKNKSTSSASRFLAHQLQREVVSVLNIRDRGVKDNNFYVLTNAKMPAALIELGFLTNPDEEKLLSKPETYSKAAQAIYDGLEAYFLYYR